MSDGCGGKAIPRAVEFGYGRSGFEGYLGNIGKIYSPNQPYSATATRHGGRVRKSRERESPARANSASVAAEGSEDDARVTR